MTSTDGYDVCVIGGGAAGLFCAATAARRGRRVLVLDHAATPGSKLLVSGGGRCNFANRQVAAGHYLSRNPDFCRSALARFGPEDFLALVEAHGIPWEERRHGQLFCRDSAQRIVDLLLAACREAGAELRWGVRVDGLAVQDGFSIATGQGAVRSGRVVVATGGLAAPATGASGLGLELARRTGHAIVEPAPALVPLLLPAHELPDLAGIAVEAEVAAEGPVFRENLLFTHRGLSGPAVLQASSYWRPGRALTVDLLPVRDLAAELAGSRSGRLPLGRLLAPSLPRRLLEARLPGALASTPVAQLSRTELGRAVAALQRWELHPTGPEGWAKAEVMRGGVDTAGLSSRSLESRLVPGLHFIGEVVDVTGWLGGYNLHWAWASGFAAGSSV